MTSGTPRWGAAKWACPLDSESAGQLLTGNVTSDSTKGMTLCAFGFSSATAIRGIFRRSTVTLAALACGSALFVAGCGSSDGDPDDWGNTDPSTSGPVSPAPVSPSPVAPGTGGPGPVSPVGPGPVSPGPVNPGPVSPTPVTPGPVSPNPVDPSPVNPGPVSPTPSSVSPTPVTPAPNPPVTPSPGSSKGSPNLFTELAGKSASEVETKLQTAVNRFFGIGTGEPNTPTRNSGYRCYYELPGDNSMAFIWAADSNDIRSEGQSYGMMIAVQMDLKTEFDKLWRFAKAKMQYPANTQHQAWKYYFKWQGFPAGNDWNFGDTTVPAPDGDEYFAAALYLADLRWGSNGEINYKQEADNIAAALIHNNPTNDGRHPIIHQQQKMIVFVPFGNSNEFTDPSYHLPAFYEMFALYGPSSDQNTWRELAEISREYLVKSAHSSTGLHPDYATFDGRPTTGNPGDQHDQFRYDAWRVVMNMAMDYAWFSQDPRMKTQVEKYHAFFANYLGPNNVSQSLFSVDGSNASGGSSTALTATLASGAMASDAPNKTSYVEALWNVPQQEGEYRYYQESVYLLALLNVAGRFNYAF
jgi:oligosaccharide reducing-end xylanase